MTRDSNTITVAGSCRDHRCQWFLAWLIRFELCWFLFCLLGGRLSEMFRETSDQLETAAPLLAFTVVNPALHLALAIVATWLLQARSGKVTAVGVSVAALNAMLILTHLVIAPIVA